MRLGISSFTFTWAVGAPGHLPAAPLGALGLVRRAAELGVRVLQFGDNLPLHALPAAERAALRHAAAREGISLQVGARGLDADLLREYVRIAADLASPFLRLVADEPAVPADPAAIAARLLPLTPDLRAAGVILAIENHDRLTALQLEEVLDRLGGLGVGICLDTVNSFGALEGPQVVVERLARWTVNLHLKDFVIFRAPQNMGFIIQGCPLGQGRLDIPWLLRTLATHGCDPDAVLELWTPAQATLEASIALERAWAEASVRAARAYISA